MQPQPLGYWLRQLFVALPAALFVAWLALTREKRKAQGRAIRDKQAKNSQGGEFE